MRTNPFPFLRVSRFPHLPTRRFSQHVDNIVPASNQLGSVQWVLSRPLYRFSRFDLKHVAKAQRPQALGLQIRQWSPYTSTGQYIVWDQDHALVWAWDADRLKSDLATQKLKASKILIFPETVLQPPIQSGLRLVTCLDGVEGQLWQAQRPVHSRWWPQPPSVSEWLNFQRDAGVTPDADGRVPTVQALPWLKYPWANAADLGRVEGLTVRHETFLFRGVFLLLAVFTVWSAVELIKTRQAAAHLTKEIARVGQTVRPLLEARSKSMDARARIESLQAANPYPLQLALLAQVAGNLPKDGAYLNDWDYQNGKLKITIVSPNKLSSSFLVKKLQDTGWFRSVQAGPSNDASTLMLTMEALPKSEITMPPSYLSGQSGADKTGETIESMKSSAKP